MATERTMEKPGVDVLLAIPTRGTVRTEWAAMLATISTPMNLKFMLRIIPDQTVVEARNTAVMIAKEHKAKYLFFLDDDVLMPNQGLRRAVHKLENEPEFDVVTGIVPVKRDPPEPAIFKYDEGVGPYWGWTFNEYFEIDACGMACCVIRMSAFDKVGEPWFTWEYDNKKDSVGEVGEDIGFCHALRNKGGRILADGGLLCAHQDPDGKTWMLNNDTAPFKRGKDALDQYTVLKAKDAQ